MKGAHYMNKRHINHRLDKLITDLENLMYYMSKQRDKTSWADDLEFLEETLGYCEEANDKLRTARAPKHRVPCYIPDHRGPGSGLISAGLAMIERSTISCWPVISCLPCIIV